MIVTHGLSSFFVEDHGETDAQIEAGMRAFYNYGPDWECTIKRNGAIAGTQRLITVLFYDNNQTIVPSTHWEFNNGEKHEGAE